MSKQIPTDHSIMKLAVAAEQHQKMHMAAASSPSSQKRTSVLIKQEDGSSRKPVIESNKHHYQGGNLISHKAGSKRKKDTVGIEPVKLAPNPFNMTAKNFPKRRHLLKNTSGFLNRTRGNNTSPNKALEQVRAALQPSLNAEIERVLHSYQEMFQMAAYNVGDNLKEQITAQHIGHILRRSLEEAKSLFKIEGETHPTGKSPDKKEKMWTSARSVIIKKKKAKREEKNEKAMNDNFDYPKIEEKNLTEETQFILGVKANKILGFASARGRLYIRHPQLFKYLGDQEDKQWLQDNGHMTMSGGKAFLMMADDIRLLAVNHPDYKDNLGIKGEDVKGFTVPESILKKMRLAIKRQTLIQEVRRESVDL
ncbi:deoxynucleotidyltransferase terminal-interacting protein 1-like [Clytia hemisphaerica]|uniref:Deoxynucleotidyltransferase terminal-interacting protein 1 n=1 Tax=Clytia hemisphaerica TaxID=252671 RepID=A0A7M5X292_9CNID